MDVFKHHPQWFLLLVFSWITGRNNEAAAAATKFISPTHPHRHHHSLIRDFAIRHRRQHNVNINVNVNADFNDNDNVNVNVDYYYIENEAFTGSEEYGNWSNWISGAECTRSCGGGVAYEIRQCSSIGSNGYSNCRGAAKRYFSCNIHDCPDAVDFRAEQCSKFDSVPFDTYFYTWVPYMKGQNKCELNCMPRGERFYYRHKKQVIDGTPCDDEKSDICVNGKCVPIGCDRLLGSPLREDKCRICGGDGSSCRTINDILIRNDVQVGYNDLLLIPAGAMNIKIRQLQYSNNYLAVRNLSNYYYLNGGWRIDVPKSFRFAGTIFHYDRIRDTLGFSAIESISALGPITESLYIVVLYQEKKADIEYEYSLTNGSIKATDAEGYQWLYDGFSNCSSSCGGGYKIRKVWCAKKRDRTAVVSDDLCDPALEPIRNQTCAQQACPPRWIVGEWTQCSHSCGTNGTQTRTIKCEQILGNGKSSSVEWDLCETSNDIRKPNTSQPCNVGLPCPKWYVGPWKACDKLCGDGFQRRDIKCYYKTSGGTISLAEDNACSGPKPESEKPCFIRPCEGVDWIVTEWSECKDSCDVAFETRSAVCSSAKGKAYPDLYCKRSKPPELTRECNASSACEYQWYAAQWSECSSTCGKGIQSRKVFCGFLKDEIIRKTNDSKCDMAKKYESSRNCSGKAQCDGQWFYGPWSVCSKSCGGGTKNRTVLCMLGNKTADVSKCNAEKIVFKRETCNNQACGDDEIIPVMPSGTVSEDSSEEECEDIEKDDVVTISSNVDSKAAFTLSGDYNTASDLYQKTELLNETSNSPIVKYLMQSDSTTDDQISTEFTTTDQPSTETPGNISTITIPITIISDSLSSSSSSSTSSSNAIDASDETKRTTTFEENSHVSSSSFATDVTPSDSSSSSSSSQNSSQSPHTTLMSDNFLFNATTWSDYETTADSSSNSISDAISTATSSTTAAFTSNENSFNTTHGESTETYTSDGSTKASNSLFIALKKETGGRPCKKKKNKPPKCQITEYGCCFDGITAASGPFSAGCAEISSCKETRYGCCPDEVSPAEGPNNENCVEIDCQLTLFGCCPDRTSAALGNNGQGCPIFIESTTADSSTNGPGNNICADNGTAELCVTTTTTAEDFTTPDDNCTTSQYGCCPDNETIASGFNFDGCAEFEGSGVDETTTDIADRTSEFYSTMISESVSIVIVDGDATTIASDSPQPSANCWNSEFGCCADNKTAATGINSKGCCSTTLYGCCPDDITPAQGPKLAGCGCQYSQFGCCSDGKTAALDESRVCRCNATKYGCCPDGIQEAQSENYAGCVDISKAGEICIQPKDKGSCRDFTVKWFFDTEYGGCSRFWYGGCDGNDNRFKTQDDCKKTCVDPPGKVPCFLPKIAGPCEGYYPSWYYDATRGQCLQFIYGGCLGNNNRFQNLKDCESLCLQTNHSTRAPQIVDSQETDVVAEEGNYVTLRCRANGFPTPTVSWRKDGSMIDRSLDRYRFSNDGYLQIIGTYVEDSGLYTCTADNSVGQPAQLDLRLTVKPRVMESATPVTPAPPYPTSPTSSPSQMPVDVFSNKPARIDTSYPTEIAAEEGSYATLKCTASGFPTPAIQWQRGTTIIDRSDGRYKLNDGVLQVIGLYESDAGLYTCIADNGVGQPDRKEYRLTIKDAVEKSADIISDSTSSMVVTFDKPSILHCYAYGYPRPTVLWWKEDKMLPRNSVQYEQRRDNSLIIRHVTLKVLGPYTCQAYNGLGRAASWTTTLHAVGPAIPLDPEDFKFVIYLVPQPEIPIQLDPSNSPSPPSVGAEITPLKPPHNFDRNIVTPSPDNRPITLATLTPPPPTQQGGVYISPNCTDNPFFANCELIVKANYCNHKYYGKFCCRSCTIGLQVPLDIGVG